MGPIKKGSEVSRAECKAKKRKLEDAIPDIPGEDIETPDDAPSTEKASKKRKRSKEDGEGVDTEESERKARKKEKKEKKGKKDDGDKDEQPEEPAEPAVEMQDDAPRKSKKERKAERKAREAAEAKENTKEAESLDAEPSKSNGDNNTPAAAAAEKKSKKSNPNREKKKASKTDGAADGEANGEVKSRASRFIVFIGNLPFSATTESVRKHFASVKPISVRHLTQKDDPAKSKGCAFIEFDGYDHMKTCLKLFHHSMFDDGISAARKINVELTAGGGGNTKDRKAKIQNKNQKLNEQRVRRIKEEEKTKMGKREAALDESGIHPSRRAQMPSIV
ncbi:uncharacterized protein BP5553_06676 [Venustampulla echinocandica]|uniref:RRM domain-containing protein n=1 Tax=Venustampulla echinocandica TaxID=2656787 RepID=A0A370TKL6_9HELO|nr:uncharacterized protein BP5553_06676 [Venustampulla echinocandica]RDL36064.1 hypothetical protein BP5553_06676 [Venustampulla echinocandica]